MVNPEFARTTITVPWDLKQQMKLVGNRVNWSAIACEAFEAKLEELGPIEEITSTAEALKRMKSIANDDQANPSKAVQEGQSAGRKWALNFATPDQLKAIETLKQKADEKEVTSWEEFLSHKVGRRKLAKCVAPKDSQFDELPGPSSRSPGGRRGSSRRRTRRMGAGGRRGGPEPQMPGWIRELEIWEKRVWKSVLSERPSHPRFFFGFAEGALDVWDELKDQF